MCFLFGLDCAVCFKSVANKPCCQPLHQKFHPVVGDSASLIVFLLFCIYLFPDFFLLYLVMGSTFWNSPAEIIVIVLFFVLSAVAITINAIIIRAVNKSTCKSDVKLWHKICGFVFCGIISGIMLCCVGEGDYVTEQPVVQDKISPFDELMKYKLMLDEGLISVEDYGAKKAKLLN